jgi:hypothetical protein
LSLWTSDRREAWAFQEQHLRPRKFPFLVPYPLHWYRSWNERISGLVYCVLKTIVSAIISGVPDTIVSGLPKMDRAGTGRWVSGSLETIIIIFFFGVFMIVCKAFQAHLLVELFPV